MKPTIAQRFFAWWWPMQIWFGLFPLFGFFLAIAVCRPTFSMFRDWQYVLLFVLAIIVAPVLFFLLGVLISFPIIGSIFYARELANGGPFKVGDTVYIIAGKHKGKVTKVYSQWQGSSVRLEIGEKEKETFKDIFGSVCLLRVNESEPEHEDS